MPEVRYAFNGEVSLGYQVVGDGPIDVVVSMGWVSNLDLQWQSPKLARFLTDLSVGHRLILMDRRGVGVSERYWPTRVSSIEALTDDLAVVMDASGSSVRHLDIEIRAGLHTGEIEYDHDNITGIAIAIGARLGALAQPSQILVSQTIKDLTAGAGLTFTNHGDHDLKGVPGPWRIYSVTTSAPHAS